MIIGIVFMRKIVAKIHFFSLICKFFIKRIFQVDSRPKCNLFCKKQKHLKNKKSLPFGRDFSAFHCFIRILL